MKPIGPTSRHLRGYLGATSCGPAARVSLPGCCRLAWLDWPSSQAGRGPGMDMQGHARARIGVPRAPYQKGAPLIEPEVRRSVNGELRTDLQVRYAYKDIGGYRLYLRSYEGTIPGPTLRVRPGDVLRIRLINNLPPNPDPVPVDMVCRTTSTRRISISTDRTSVRREFPTISFDRWSPGRVTISRSPSLEIIRGAPIGIIRITTAAPMSRSPEAWQAR